MIFVTLGTQDKPFVRMLELLDRKVNDGTIKGKIIVQAGHTKYESSNMEIFDYVSADIFDKYINDCDLLITHGGVGSIFTGLKHNKKILVMPRLAEYKEQHNNHQLEIVEEFTKCGYILSFNDDDSFDRAYSKIKDFKPKKYKSNTKNMISLIADFIDNN